jgi:hypothetical protein
LEQFRYLKIAPTEIHADNARMEFLDLSLHFLLDLDFALKQLGKSAHDIVGAFFYIMQFLFLNFLEEPGRHFFT